MAGLGTTGTLMGVGRFLREQVPGVQIVAAEPRYGELVYGLRNVDEGFVPELYDPSGADHPVLGLVGGRAAPHPRAAGRRGHLRRHLLRLRAARRAGHGGQGVGRRASGPTSRFIVADGGWKYLSTGAYSGTLEEAEARLEGQLWA